MLKGASSEKVRWAVWRGGSDNMLRISQRFSGLGNEPPQTGHTFSVGLIIRLALHLEHLTGWSLALSISTVSRLVIRFLRFRKVLLSCLETLKDRIFCIAVPTDNMVIAHRPGDMYVTVWTLLGWP
jgi:hypothetical protein